MAPATDFLRKGPGTSRYLFVTVEDWLERKRANDGAEGLWRVHDKLYDLSTWTEKHPGGRYWLETTKGTDITEAFEANHFTGKAEKILSKFYVRPAKTQRNSLITFHENGFYKTLKRRIVEKKLISGESTKPQDRTKLLADVLAAAVLATALLGTLQASWHLLCASGVLLSMLAVCSHNFFHMGDNWRMYYIQMSLMSLREWRISHVLSHHLYPNTALDLEVLMVDPIWRFLPTVKKNHKYLTWAMGPLLMMSMSHVQFLRRIVTGALTKSIPVEELIGFLLPLLLYTVTGQGFWTTFAAWNVIIASASLTFGFVGFTAAHHHPHIYHEGDYFGNDKDFGLLQLAAVRNRIAVDGNFFLTLTMFGEHTLHHLFPTVDHSKLPALRAVFAETCRDFNINFKPFTVTSLTIGMFQQLARTYKNAKLFILADN